ncbi:hypothetical protein [Acinetobacter kyonggiensis]|jgi:hypothetical protein|uniref:Uncharacterized protein n=1 Tax=Acinetobacter kyonggiensis TaxID=595670 RepID=A0A1H3N079_9GAMM|nr:hypothetical protein [Acinetobacter kyonggiensis]SDY82361.1 hypothetical protein SAMN05421643_13420 [Acinetobacter kyonggiensis]
MITLVEKREIDLDDFNTAKLVELSLSLSTVEVITDDAIVDFTDDDGGY